MKKNELTQILQEGEGQFVEFKEKLDNSLVKEIVAFANASGGRIFLGIDDSGKIKGLSITNRLKSQIVDYGKNCDPEIPLSLETLDNIMIIHVPEGLNKPYQGSKGFYLRLGANSQKLKRDKILEFSINENKIRFDEQICPDFNFKDFDDEKFEYYLKLAGITKILDKESFLRNLKVLNEKGMTNAGVLFFARSPYKYIFSSKIRCVHFRGNERIEILDKKEVDKGIIGNIEYAINYIKERVPVRFEIKGSRRIEHPEFPEDAYREVIVNAVIHRDYYESGEVAVEKLKNSILINNPGGLIPSFPREQFGNWSWPRNRLLADLLSKTIFMEKVGTGIRRIRKFCLENNNAIDIKPGDTYFSVEMKSPKAIEITEQNVGENVGVNVGENLSKNQNLILQLLLENKYLSIEKLAETLGITVRSIERNISGLKEKGLLERIGSDKTGYWKVNTIEKFTLDVGENAGVNVGVNVGENVGVNLSKNQNLILQLLLENKELSIEKLAESLGIAARSIERNISILKDKGLLERIGSDRTGYWKVTPGGAQIIGCS
ncbi:MAG: putative DNA binding domain-containing protein [Candidatus Aminicenantes bacterium]|nr:MAG: putative DNA binding domain-containing protein [Candidatus Aminicenantes bacterium]